MAREILIDPVTRVEGHAKISIQLDDNGEVLDAFLHVTQFRGFEKFCEGRPFTEMPSLVARICGICPVSHLLSSAKACDALLAVKVPPTGEKLRRMLNHAQYVQSHALSFFHLSAPDLVMGFESDPAKRNIFGMAEKEPELAKSGIRLRQIGQRIIEILGSKRIHPAWVVPGGVNEALTGEKKEQIRALLPEGLQIIQNTLKWYKVFFEQFRDEIRIFGNFPSMFMGLVTPARQGLKGAFLEHYNGVIRFVDAFGNLVEDNLNPADYQQFIGEAVEPFSYLKAPYYKAHGYPEGIYRVGPLARLNIVDCPGTPRADEEWTEFRALRRGVVLSSFHFLYARLIEILFSLEKIEELLNDPDITDTHVRAVAAPNCHEGVGVTEAPRGTLIHHYKIDDDGLITWANMIVASGNNNLAMNKSVAQVAKHYVKGDRLTEGMLNRVEAVVRDYDPCFSCSTHAVGQMPIVVTLLNSKGQLIDRLVRD